MFLKFAALLAAAAGSLPLTMSATTITPGSFFNLTGMITVSNAGNPTITFSDGTVTPPIPNQGAIASPVGGTFLTANAGGTVAGQNVTIGQLNSVSEPVNTLSSDPLWLQFQASDNLPSLTLTFIPAGVDDPTGCAATPSLPGQMCTPVVGTPLVPGPFSFQNLSGGGSSVGFVFDGVTSDNADSFEGVFTAQFTIPFQTVLTNLGSQGSVSNSFSGTITFAATPEPGSFVLMGIGLILLIATARIYRRAV